MPEVLENIAFAIGGGLVSPGVGAAELVLGLLVGLGFAWSAIRAALAGCHPPEDRRLPERRP